MYCKGFHDEVKFVDAKITQKKRLTSDLFRGIRVKSQVYKYYKLGRIWQEKCNANNIWVKVKATYFMYSFTSYQYDIKDTWSHIMKLLSQSLIRKSIKNVIIYGNEIIVDLEILNRVNRYFRRVAFDLDLHLPNSNNFPLYFLNINQPTSLFLYPLAECSRIIVD